MLLAGGDQARNAPASTQRTAPGPPTGSDTPTVTRAQTNPATDTRQATPSTNSASAGNSAPPLAGSSSTAPPPPKSRRKKVADPPKPPLAEHGGDMNGVARRLHRKHVRSGGHSAMLSPPPATPAARSTAAQSAPGSVECATASPASASLPPSQNGRRQSLVACWRALSSARRFSSSGSSLSQRSMVCR